MLEGMKEKRQSEYCVRRPRLKESKTVLFVGHAADHTLQTVINKVPQEPQDVRLYLSGPVARFNAMLPEAGQASGVRCTAHIPVGCGPTVYDPLKQQRTEKGGANYS